MMRQVMESAGLSWWPVTSLLMFFGFSIGMVFWLYRKGSKEFYSKLSNLALKDGELEVTSNSKTKGVSNPTGEGAR